MTDFLMTAENSSPPGAYVGYQRGFSGDMEPAEALGFEIVRCEWDISADTFIFELDTTTLLQDAFESITVETDDGVVTLLTADAGFSAVGTCSWTWDNPEPEHNMFTDGDNYDLSIPDAPDEDTFNCDCEEVSTYDTLTQLRRKMLIRLGYAAMADNPPPGILNEIDQLLNDAQRELYRKNITLRTKRLFKWTMVPGQRFYGFADEEGNCKSIDGDCKIEWVGYEDLNQAWYPLACGIDPTLYTRVNTMTGYPQRYEIRSCIEIWPAPQAAYTLWLKGDFGVTDMTQGTDRPSIPDHAVYLLALGYGLSARNKPNAGQVLTEASNYVLDLVANSHKTARYIPRAGLPPPAIPPKFLPLGDAPP